MKNITLIMTAIFLCDFTKQQEGCLLMDKNFECVVCDFFSGYIPDQDNQCQKQKIENCLIQTYKGLCLICQDNYYFDSNTNKCLQVENYVENCLLYVKDNQCKQCDEGYLLKNTQCFEVENIIEGCSIYSNDGFCKYCKNGYVLGLDNSSCIQITTQVDNCLSYNFVHCEECEKGYIHNPSLYSFIKTSEIEERLQEIAQNLIFKNLDSKSKKFCQSHQVSNCLSFANFKQCKICKENYYLTSDLQCSQFPSSRIENCLVYESSKKCKICEETFHVDELGNCVKNSEIENCQKYDQSSVITTCILCKKDYYILSNKCIIRAENNINNCLQYNPYGDNCIECNENYKVTDDLLKCLAVIENCFVYEVSDKNLEAHQCKQCSENHFITEQKQCAIGQVQNCFILKSSTQCQKCQNKYYLDENELCVLHQNLLQCDEYSTTENKTCTKCQNNSILMSTGKMCKIAGFIDGCLKFKDEQNCEVCKEGYQLLTIDSKKICREIDEFPNCLQLDQTGDNCLKCQQNYVLFPNPENDSKIQCKNPQIFYNQNCRDNNLQSGLTSWKDAKCLLCEQNYIPYNQLNQFVCMEQQFVHILLADKSQEQTIKQNCQKLSFESNQYKCVKCIAGYYLQDNECKIQCVDGDGENSQFFPLNLVDISSFTESSVDRFKIEKVNYCNTIQPDSESLFYKCQLISPFFYVNDHTLESINFSKKCVQCRDDSLPIIEPISVLFKSDNFQPIEIVTNMVEMVEEEQELNMNPPILHQMPIKECIDNNLSTINKIQNCQYYRLIQGEYYCSRCKNFYKGEVSKKNNKYYISQCVPIDTCTALFYPGLPAILNFMTTCYECFEGKIPVIFANRIEDSDNFVDIDAEYFLPYNTNAKIGQWAKQYENNLDATGVGFTVECYDRNSSEIAINVNFPLQCSLGIYWVPFDVSIPSAQHMTNLYNVDPLKIQLICAACKPGYKRIGSFYGIDNTTQKVKYMVQDCVEIQNCNRSQWMNYCTTCNRNYAFSIQNKRVQYDECIYTPDQNCYAIDKDTQKCQICKKGFVFNFDGVCEEFSPPQCQEYNQLDNLPSTMLSTLLYMFPSGKGCNKCNNDEIAIQISQRSISCIYSTYIQNTNILSSSKYIKNCKFYFNESEVLKCQQCVDDYVVNNIFNTCYSKTNLSNCEIALDFEKCLQCINEYISVDYKCQQKNLANCLLYDSDSSLTEQKCIKCQSGYYLSQNQCLIGDIQYCEEYGENLNQCQKCLSGYQKIQIKDADYCLQIDLRSFCEEVDQIKFQNQILECKSCKSGQNLYLPDEIPSNQEKSICTNTNEISNCLVYDTQNLFQNSTLKCEKCVDGYYSIGFKCRIIKNIDQNCETYSLYADRCEKCVQNYFLNQSYQCEQNPSGIQGCVIYSNQTDCKVCDENYYLQRNFCVLVEEESRIKNCKYYENPALCFECKDEYYLVNNECVEVLAQNCKIYEDINNCSSCEYGWGLKKQNSKTNCVQITDPNCINYEIEFPFACLQCAFGFYPNSDGVCAPVLNAIENCLTYKSENSCSVCKKEYMLSPDFSECLNSGKFKISLDPNCKQSQYVQSPVCQICKQGYYMTTDYQCKQCEGSNCFFCDSIDSKKCTICKFGYYMNSNFECVSLQDTVQQEVEQVQEFLMIFNTIIKIFVLLYNQL